MNESMIQRIEEMGKKKFKRHVFNVTLPFTAVVIGTEDMNRLIAQGYAKELCNIPCPLGLLTDNVFDDISKDMFRPGDTILETISDPSQHTEWEEDGSWEEVLDYTKAEERLFVHKRLYMVSVCDSFVFYADGDVFTGPTVTPELMLVLDVLDVPVKLDYRHWGWVDQCCNTDYTDMVLSSGRGDWVAGKPERLFLEGPVSSDTYVPVILEDHFDKMMVYFGEIVGRRFYQHCGRVLMCCPNMASCYHNAEQLWWLETLGVEYHFEDYWRMEEGQR